MLVGLVLGRVLSQTQTLERDVLHSVRLGYKVRVKDQSGLSAREFYA